MNQAPFVLHPPTGEGAHAQDLLILWHGAGGDIDQPLLKELARAFADAGGTACRARFPYRIAGRKMPDRMPSLVAAARATVLEVQANLQSPPRHLYLGGRSMGGRVASMLAAEGAEMSGLIFLSYPLHSEKKPEQLRDQHLYGLRVPMLFVQGDRDALAEMPRLGPVLARLGDQATFELFPGADHTFSKVDPAEVVRRTLAWLSKRTELSAG
ncbi:MAG: dienelactone hydrolase family protein [Deltaproteobacteria bacterium]|jgi:predicted alpha/beta-hydrolase family hydrolase|nr:dienelactone hydrolase family protein [Deltaproteobacteria bacterium]